MFIIIMIFIMINTITRAKCALDRRTNLRLFVTGFQRQNFKHVNFLSERSKKMKDKRRTTGASLLRNPLTIHKVHGLASY